MPPNDPLPRALPRAWNTRIDFVGPMRWTLLTALLMSLGSLGLLATRGLNYGTDFAGGYELQVAFDREVGEAQIRDQLVPAGFGEARVQRFGAAAEHRVLIMVRGEASGLAAGAEARLGRELAALTPDVPLAALTVAHSGERLQVVFARPVEEASLRRAVAAAGLVAADVQVGQREDRPEYVVRLVGVAERVGRALVDGLGRGEAAARVERVDFVGPQVGAQLRAQGVMAVVYALVFIFLYVAARFDMLFSPGAILATLHDLAVTMGLLSLLRVEFSLNVVAALLTLIGFSLNDTIVVYDRIRENVGLAPEVPLGTQVNRAINETLSRTVLTSGTVVLVTLALLVLGGPFLYGLSVTMLIGVLIGTYSSIAVAAPLYMLFARRFGRAGAAGPRGLRPGGAHPARVAGASTPAR